MLQYQYIIKDNYTFYPQIFLEEALVELKIISIDII